MHTWMHTFLKMREQASSKSEINRAFSLNFNQYVYYVYYVYSCKCQNSMTTKRRSSPERRRPRTFRTLTPGEFPGCTGMHLYMRALARPGFVSAALTSVFATLTPGEFPGCTGMHLYMRALARPGFVSAALTSVFATLTPGEFPGCTGMHLYTRP